ncbi:hypothetical protein ACQZ61_09280 [Agrobacterium vitis]|uniref:Uncharacterized protein n=1 Tax=Agrobacterium vitis TaxID=373 RepID=A0A368NWG4_AGRVI|nr:hypothetical protein [Agrobacterium vitis]KAA3519594.1 hypothetical protein DXM22_01445 [Agrobacterium vitis]KAA3532195.1 hypothetical protein DXT89_02275 [Agrobacterium vitis]MCE6074553.1 hypothetical protein [Agrobacterium vitis]MCF1451217.1 hypothetical protein [Agrobacterium vitis]MCF1467123.1 hypothetical protein [Agrobacterium vitis]
MRDITLRLTAVTVIMAVFAALFSILVINSTRIPQNLRTGLTGERLYSLQDRSAPSAPRIAARRG